MTLALGAALALAFSLVRDTRARIKELLLPLAGAYLLAGLLTSPFLYYVLRDPVRTSLSPPRGLRHRRSRLRRPVSGGSRVEGLGRRHRATLHDQPR